MPTHTDYLLLLNFIFHDHATRLRQMTEQFPTQDAFKEGFSGWLSSQSSLKEMAHYYQKRVAEFNLDRYKTHLEKAGIHVLDIDNPQYPENLRQIYDPPMLLFAKGNAALLNEPILSVVGSRSHSVYGTLAAQMMVQELAPYFVIASGMARGLDTVAHTKALELGKPTIAVLPTGLDMPYPAQNQRLYERILESGLVITEQPIGTPALGYRFPLRNRIISGISEGVLVVEAGHRSGAVITANLAMEQGRNVYAIPGQITSVHSQGTHRLIQDGAKLVHEANDILVDFQRQAELPFEPVPKVKATPRPDLSENESNVYSLLAQKPLGVDELTTQLSLNISTLLHTLTLLEMKQIVTQESGVYALK